MDLFKSTHKIIFPFLESLQLEVLVSKTILQNSIVLREPNSIQLTGITK